MLAEAYPDLGCQAHPAAGHACRTGYHGYHAELRCTVLVHAGASRPAPAVRAWAESVGIGLEFPLHPADSKQTSPKFQHLLGLTYPCRTFAQDPQKPQKIRPHGLVVQTWSYNCNQNLCRSVPETHGTKSVVWRGNRLTASPGRGLAGIDDSHHLRFCRLAG